MNPKTRSIIIRNVAPVIISFRIGFKAGIYDKKTTTNTIEAIPFSMLLHFFGFIRFFNSFQVNYCSFIEYFVIVKMHITME